MNKFRGSLGVKLGAMFLFVLFFAVSALGVCAIIFSTAQNVYTDGGAYLREQALYSETYNKLYSFGSYVENFTREDGESVLSDIPAAFNQENTNVSVRITDSEGNLLYENFPVEEYIYYGKTKVLLNSEVNESTQTFYTFEAANEYAQKYHLADPYAEISINVKNDGGEILYIFTNKDAEKDLYTLEGYVRKDLSAKDNIYTAMRLIDLVVDARYTIIIITVAAVLLTIILFIFLLCCAGHKSGVPGIHLCWYDKIPFDILLLALLCLAYFTLAVIDTFGHFDVYIAMAVAALLWLPILMGTLMSFSARAKAGAWWKNTFIYASLSFIWKCAVKIFSFAVFLIKNIPLVWKFVLFWIITSIFELIVIDAFVRMFNSGFLPMWVSYKTVMTAIYAVCAVSFVRLKKAAERIAGGDLTHRPDSRYMFGDFASHAKTLGSISDGIQLAVDRQLKSERMKTELITNVSHDIKTPLTSIINYVDLLKKEDIEGEKASEYIEVLDRQSKRLKKLTDDLVEASKAQTGNIQVNFGQCDAAVLVSQAYGEYEDKMSEMGLVPILTLPEEASLIYADGKLLWRVFDNLFSNICKYAMTGTRVFVSVENLNGNIIITFKNISGSPINITGEELSERFVRGDKSRNSEGSGLGLSIAKSLTQLMYGSFDITVDGDLFKVAIAFKQVK